MHAEVVAVRLEACLQVWERDIQPRKRASPYRSSSHTVEMHHTVAQGMSRPTRWHRHVEDSGSSSDEEDDFQKMLRKMFNPNELQKERERQRYHESMVNAGRTNFGKKGRSNQFVRYGVQANESRRQGLKALPLLGTTIVSRQLVPSRGCQGWYHSEMSVDDEDNGDIDADLSDDIDDDDYDGDGDFDDDEGENDEVLAIRLEGELAQVGKDVIEHYSHRGIRGSTDIGRPEETSTTISNLEQKREHGKTVHDSEAAPRPATTSAHKRKPSEKRILATRLIELGRSRSERNLLLLKQDPVSVMETDQVSSRLQRISSRLSLHDVRGNSGRSLVSPKRPEEDRGEKASKTGTFTQKVPLPTKREAEDPSFCRGRRISRRGSLRRCRIGLDHLDIDESAFEPSEGLLLDELDW